MSCAGIPCPTPVRVVNGRDFDNVTLLKPDLQVSQFLAQNACCTIPYSADYALSLYNQGTYEVPAGETVRVEFWDADGSGQPLGSSPIGFADLAGPIAINETKAFAGTITGINNLLQGVVALTPRTYAGGTLCSCGIDFKTSNNVPMPVEWASFEAIWQGPDAALTWVTASEVNAASFEVQRSLDGSTFSSIGQVEAAGNTSESTLYTFTDAQAAALQTTLYYRLLQRDIDGASNLSGVRTLALSHAEGHLRIAPNPAQTLVTLSFTLAPFERGTIQIMNALGQTVEQVFTPGTANGMGQANLSVESWPKGVYMVQVMSETQAYSQRLVIE